MRGDDRMNRRGDDELEHGNTELKDFYTNSSQWKIKICGTEWEVVIDFIIMIVTVLTFNYLSDDSSIDGEFWRFLVEFFLHHFGFYSEI